MTTSTPDEHELDGIDLADAIQSVRDQLLDAATRASHQPLLFEVGEIELEFTVELRKEVAGGAKIKAWVVEAGAEASRSAGRTHRVAFTLTPKDPATGRSIMVGNPDLGDISGFGGDTSGSTGAS
ncbi:trypco2 family protein [Streptomyces tibetensis]|uniref:trypco2 family protein n=1 Tax=Streptomyces tibetensis TaxID=2382123 RepID=UPI003803A031